MITVNLFIYEMERKCDTQKRLGARKTTLLPKQSWAVLLPYPPKPLPLGSLRNRDVDFSRIYKLPHHRFLKKIRMEERFEGFSVQKNVSVQTEQMKLGLPAGLKLPK